MNVRGIFVFAASCGLVVATQESTPAPPPAPVAAEAPAAAPAMPVAPDAYTVTTGTKIPLSMINSISTKYAEEGDRVYLQTVFPILDHGRVVIPPGSYVEGTVMHVKRPGKVKGRGEFYLRFDSLVLPNGTTRDFRARLDDLDGRAKEKLDKKEGNIKSEGDKAGDTRTIAETTAAGAGLGGLAGVSAGHAGMGTAIGAGAGAAAGLLTVLLTRGPDAILARGSTVEMVLDRPLRFQTAELNFNSSTPPLNVSDGPGPEPSRRERGIAGPRWPN